MHSDMIGKIEKARRYAEEPDRIQISELKAYFQGSNNTHLVTFTDGQWTCDSPSFQTWGTSAHIMAIQKVLEPMLTPEMRQPIEPIGMHMQSEMVGKIEKARRYAEEPQRIQIFELKARFHGSNSEHDVALKDGKWYTDDAFFRNWGTSAHIMAMQRLLDRVLVPEARQPAMSELSSAHTETASL